MQRYCPVCDERMPQDLCPVHEVPTVDEACFERAHIAMIPGDVVDGEFTIVRQLGEGSMGTVYEVSTPQVPRLALKVIKVREDSSRQVTKRFYREALAASKVRHSSIVKIVQFGVDARTGQPYQAMEFIEGHTLFDFMETGVKSMAVIMDVAGQVLEALGHLHQHGIVHRDLKPENVMLISTESSVEVKLLDFGIAKILEHDGDAPTLTATGVAVGTPHYMSPEQAKGSKVTVKADLYSLGCLLFELLTGRPPFDGNDFMSVLISHVRDDIPHLPPMTHWGEPIPQGLRDEVYRSLSKEPDARAADATEMLSKLLGQSQESDSISTESLPFDKRASKNWLAVIVIFVILGGWLLIR
jgi:eukaryotic-like serine/threonine-protein kinase